jgi:hypothetical protein
MPHDGIECSRRETWRLKESPEPQSPPSAASSSSRYSAAAGQTREHAKKKIRSGSAPRSLATTTTTTSRKRKQSGGTLVTTIQNFPQPILDLGKGTRYLYFQCFPSLECQPTVLHNLLRSRDKNRYPPPKSA